MNPLTAYSAHLSQLDISNWWAPTQNDLEQIATKVLGPRPGGWVRKAGAGMMIGTRQLAADPRTLEIEVRTLAELTQKILARGEPLLAAAFFHLRFENIHPLHDGNGRVGRTLLAAQCEQKWGASRIETLEQLHAHERDYKLVFVTDDQSVRFELLVDFIARITGCPPPSEKPELPFPVTPLHLIKLPKNFRLPLKQSLPKGR